MSELVVVCRRHPLRWGARKRLAAGLASVLLFGTVLALAGPAAPAAAQYPEHADLPEVASDGRELLMPACAPEAARSAKAEAKKIKFVLCEDNLTVSSLATGPDITFYPRFTPERRNYVVHVADDVSEVRWQTVFHRRSSMNYRTVRQDPGWSHGVVEGVGVQHPSCRECRWATAGNLQDATLSARLTLTPGVTTVKFRLSRWFQRWGPSAEEAANPRDYSWVQSSDKVAHTVYTLQVVWQSPDTALEAPDEPDGPIRSVDYDTDDDGLIEVSSLAQLNALRWDADADGYSDHGGPLHDGFPNALLGMGCPNSGCVGYELDEDLDFDTNASGGADAGDDWWNRGHGWVPIGADTDDFSGVFEGNGHVISNLFINSNQTTLPRGTGYAQRSDWDRLIYLGLFEGLARGGVVRNVGLEGVSVAQGFRCAAVVIRRCAAGGLAGVSAGTISNSWVTGAVSSTVTAGATSSYTAHVGGLVGLAHEQSAITGSFSEADVSVSHGPSSEVGSRAGGLVGTNHGLITASGATGAVASDGDPASRTPSHLIGGLVASNNGSITASYSAGAVSGDFERSGLVGAGRAAQVADSYWDATSSGAARSAGGTAKSTGQLQTPTDYTGIYADWDVDIDGDGSADDPWAFGACNQYPRPKSAGAHSASSAAAATYSVTAAASATEGASASLTITLASAAPAGGVQFAVATDFGGDSTATASDVGPIASPVTVAAQATSATVTVPTARDGFQEQDETFTVTVTADTACWAPSTAGADAATVTITDDDTPGVTVDAVSPLQVDESATATYTVVLDSRPTESVTITAYSADTDAVTVSPRSAIFGASNWDIPVTFTVTAVADDDTDDETVAVTHRVTRGPEEYETVPMPTVSVAVTDTTPPQQQQRATGLPGPVIDLTLKATPDSVTVRWQPPASGDAPKRYIVHLRPEGGKAGSGVTKNPKAKKTEVRFDSLEAGRTYRVWVRAKNNSGSGERTHATITLPAPDGERAKE